MDWFTVARLVGEHSVMDTTDSSGVHGASSEPPRADLSRRLADGSATLAPSELIARSPDDLRAPGLYSWWVEHEGAGQLSNGLGHLVRPGLIYAGSAGATRWPSGRRSRNTLWVRLVGMHLGRRRQFSTFRRALGAVLTPIGDDIDEEALTTWMHAHLRVIAVPVENADELGRAEREVLHELNPPLNLSGVPATPLRLELRRLRSARRHQAC